MVRALSFTSPDLPSVVNIINGLEGSTQHDNHHGTDFKVARVMQFQVIYSGTVAGATLGLVVLVEGEGA